MLTLHPTRGASASHYYTPTAAVLKEIAPDFSLDRPTAFFTEAYFLDAHGRCAVSPLEEDRNIKPCMGDLACKSGARVLSKMLVRYRHSVERGASRETLAFVDRCRQGKQFNAFIPGVDVGNDINGLTMYLRRNEPMPDAEQPDGLVGGYGILRYVISDRITLDRVLFNVPSMLSVATDNRHSQFCIGTVCASDVQDVLIVKTRLASDETKMTCNLPHSEPPLSLCRTRAHSYCPSYWYTTEDCRNFPKTRVAPRVLSDLRPPAPADFAPLGLEVAYAHALANPPPKRERWEDFPMFKIVTVGAPPATEESSSDAPVSTADKTV